MYLLQYVQPRQAFFDPTMPIFERKQHIVGYDGASEEDARRTARAFLRNGAVQCGDNVYRRTRISLSCLPPFAPARGPKPEFLPMDECFS